MDGPVLPFCVKSVKSYDRRLTILFPKSISIGTHYSIEPRPMKWNTPLEKVGFISSLFAF